MTNSYHFILESVNCPFYLTVVRGNRERQPICHKNIFISLGVPFNIYFKLPKIAFDTLGITFNNG